VSISRSPGPTTMRAEPSARNPISQTSA